MIRVVNDTYVISRNYTLVEGDYLNHDETATLNIKSLYNCKSVVINSNIRLVTSSYILHYTTMH